MSIVARLLLAVAIIATVENANADLGDHSHHPTTVRTTTCAPEPTTTKGPKCTKKCTGGKHDKCTLCGTACPATCEDSSNKACTLQCIVNVCRCEPGYVRGPDGKCIRKDQCPKKCTKKCTGGPHDKCTLCGSACPLTCDKLKPGKCTKDCRVNVCQCEDGYVRAPNGQCVKPKHCPVPTTTTCAPPTTTTKPPKCTKKCTGGKYDKCTLCGSACPLTCKNPKPRPCTKQCIVNVCECIKGYVRAKNGKCIKPSHCRPEDC